LYISWTNKRFDNIKMQGATVKKRKKISYATAQRNLCALSLLCFVLSWNDIRGFSLGHLQLICSPQLAICIRISC